MVKSLKSKTNCETRVSSCNRKKPTKQEDIRYGIATELHAPARRNFRRRRVVTAGFDFLWQADLVQMIPYAKSNEGMKYILTVIDVYSKYAWAQPVSQKTGKQIVEAFNRILSEPSGRKPRMLQTDAGKEFYNARFQEFCRENGIHHYSSYSHLKASVVERFNRTLKERMWRRFSAQGTRRWLDMLPILIKEYNASIHRTIGMEPIKVSPSTKLGHVYNKVKLLDPRHDRFRVGDVVRVSKYKRVFEKGFEANWTTELFTISRIHLSDPVTFTLKDCRGETILGRFYSEEMKRTRFPNYFLIEKVLRKKGPLRYVRWLGLSKYFDSWIHERDIV